VASSAPVQWCISDHRPNEANCVRHAPAWRKSSYSPNESDCVEVAPVQQTLAESTS
jgi:hypothetical protein